MLTKALFTGGTLAGAMAVAYLAGSLTLGGARAQTQPPVTPTPAATVPAQSSPATPAAEPAAHDQATGTPEADAGSQEQQPSYTSSVTLPQDQNASGAADDAATLQGKATITADQARAAALARFSGATIQAVELENENGNVVYGVQLTDASGQAQDVKVDAGNGKILHVEADGTGGHDGSEGTSENKEAGSGQ